MFIGIDVGGTYTDAVLTDGSQIIAKHKTVTRHENLLDSLIAALDAVTLDMDVSLVNRIVISTTLVTNVIAEKKTPPVALILSPGPGLSHSEYRFHTLTHIISGAIDFRGREIAPIDREEVVRAGQDIKAQGYSTAAVVGKFSNRNQSHEILIKGLLDSDLNIEMGHLISGRLNYPRRIATTMLTAATKSVFAGFLDAVKNSLKQRNIAAPVFILKADGGTLPPDSSLRMPVETIFSGPAASALGAMSLSPKGQTSVVADIGGTTTDLALILSGKPLLASKGAVVEDYLTNITSFAVRSVPVGGDSTVVVKKGKVQILPQRQGPAYCMGGEGLTPSDALRFLNKTGVGDFSRAVHIINKTAAEAEKNPEELAAEIISEAARIIVNAIEQMFINWEQEPAYRIWEFKQRTKIRPNNVVGVGGAAKGLIPTVAALMNCNAIIPEHAEVANALGAAAAQPTVTANVRIDTEQGTYTLVEDGYSGKLAQGQPFTEADALKLAKDALFARAERLGVKEYVKELEVVHSEVFNMVRNWTTTGKIFDISVQTPRDILFYLGQEQ